jgi:hypothetical protein
MKQVILAGLCLAIGACSTAHGIRGADGEPLVMVECGAATSFSACYDRAAKECPKGYRTVAEESGINRKTLKVECKQ